MPAETIRPNHHQDRRGAGRRNNRRRCWCWATPTVALAVIPAKRRKIPVFHMEAGNRCFRPARARRDQPAHCGPCQRHQPLLYRAWPPLSPGGRSAARPGHENRIAHEGGFGLSPRRHWRLHDFINAWGLNRAAIFTVSIHREENVDNPIHLSSLVEAPEHAGR